MAGSNRERRAVFGIAAVALIALSGAACTAAISPSPVAASPAPAAMTASGFGQTQTPNRPSDTPASTGTLDPDASESPTPPLPTGPLPSLNPVPAGLWTGIKWIAISGGHSPAVPASLPDEEFPTIILAGSSKGYAEFAWNSSKRTLTPWFSADGLSWNAGANLDLGAWTSYFKLYDAQNDGSDSEWHDRCEFWDSNFQEGPQALLLRASLHCGGDTCGTPDVSGQASWTSENGVSWTPAIIPGTVTGLVSGGSRGFVALGSDGPISTIWTSHDGRAWTQGKLPPAALAVGSYAESPVSFAGGYVLPGVVMATKGSQTGGSSGCISDGMDLSQYQGALWWSPDGSTWTRDTLSGATPTDKGVSMSLVRIDEHTVVAVQQLGDTKTEWVSVDGRTWTTRNGKIAFDSGDEVVGRDRGLIQSCDGGFATLCVFNDKLDLVTLKQSGDLPWWDDGPQLVLGPTGILASDDGNRFWIGVPTAG